MEKSVGLSRSSERSQETRQRLIDAALDLFGAQGFEGTSTRALAEQAQVNLAAIPYHFGSKEKLYRAIASHVVGELRRHLSEPAGLFSAQDPAPLAPAAARARLHVIIDRVVDVMTDQTSAPWARFIIREQQEPTAAFEILYEGFFEPVQNQICGLMALALKRKPADPALRLQGLAFIAQILMFRWARPAVIKRLGAETLGASERAAIKRMLHFNLDAILDAGGAP
jgi:TetR/AcrR family transcriptional regulator, regulator of cefoperazone and chloramphenicol sensitivity